MSFSFRQATAATRSSKGDNLFAGRSTLRADEKKKEEGPPKDSALQAYLAKNYSIGDKDGAGAGKRKKKQKSGLDAVGASRIVDQDVSGFNALDPKGRGTLTKRRANTGDDDDEEEEEAPTVANPEEAAALLKQVDKAKSGSGWVPAAGAGERAAPAGPSRRHDSTDASPPRRRKRHDSPDASPPRRGARQASPDASPPRRRQRHDSPDAAPPRRGAGPDAAPPRRSVRQASPDASPPRRGTVPDASPPRRRTRHDSPDAAPPRRPPPGTGPGTGPSRAGPGAGPGVGPSRPQPGPPERMGDGTAAGLVNAQQLAADIAKQREQAEERRRNAEGRGAQTVYRDKATGRVMTADEALQAKEDERASRKKPSIYDEDQTLEWRGGLAQKREAEERRRAAQEEASKPFARADVDDQHDAALRDRVRFGDPFAHLARRKQPAAADALLALTDQYDQEKLNKSGFKIPQEVPVHSWLKRGVAPPANRYNIRPGRHWDGVDRSTGFEKQMFKHQNMRAAEELEARLWSMSDM